MKVVPNVARVVVVAAATALLAAPHAADAQRTPRAPQLAAQQPQPAAQQQPQQQQPAAVQQPQPQAGAQAAGQQPQAAPDEPPADSPRMVEAREHLEQGARLFRAGNYDAALAEFERVYELYEGHPRRYQLLFNIAQCHERMFRYDLALQYYERFLREGGPDAPRRDAVEATIAALEGLLATVRITVNVPTAEVWVDDRRAGTAPGQVRIPSGRHVVELRTSGYLPARQEVQVAARATQDLTFRMERVPPQRRGISPVFFWSSAGVAVVAAGVGAVFGLQALGARGSVDMRLANEATRFEVTEEDRSRIRQAAVTADVFYAGAALFAVGAGVLFFLTEWRSPPRPQQDRAGARARVAPLAGHGALGASLAGAF